jgi:hypothetical protein
VALRCAVGGAEVARSRPAGLVFALVLAALVAVIGPRRPRRPAPERARVAVRGRQWRRWGAATLGGLVGGAVLCVPALAATGLDTLGTGPRVGFLGWAAVVTVVATAEERFLRGALFGLLQARGTAVAIAVPALAFAALHVPLYGWGAAPLDLAVGVWLGALRAATGTWLTPAVAHVTADWAAWALA